MWFNVSLLQGAIEVRKKYDFLMLKRVDDKNCYSFLLYCTTLMHNDKIFQVILQPLDKYDSSNEFKFSSYFFSIAVGKLIRKRHEDYLSIKCRQ